MSIRARFNVNLRNEEGFIRQLKKWKFVESALGATHQLTSNQARFSVHFRSIENTFIHTQDTSNEIKWR